MRSLSLGWVVITFFNENEKKKSPGHTGVAGVNQGEKTGKAETQTAFFRAAAILLFCSSANFIGT